MGEPTRSPRILRRRFEDAAVADALGGGIVFLRVAPQGAVRIARVTPVARRRIGGNVVARRLDEVLDAAVANTLRRAVVSVAWGGTPSPSTLATFSLGEAELVDPVAVRLSSRCVALVVGGGEGVRWLVADQYVALVERSPNLVGLLGFDFRILYLNDAGLALTGLGTLDRAQSVDFTDLLKPEGLRQAREEELPAVLSDTGWQGVRQLREMQTGRLIEVEVDSFLLTERSSGEPIAMATIQRDVTARLQLEHELREGEARLRMVVDQTPAFVWTTDRDLRVTEVLGELPEHPSKT